MKNNLNCQICLCVIILLSSHNVSLHLLTENLNAHTLPSPASLSLIGHKDASQYMLSIYPGLRSIQRPYCTISLFLFIHYIYSSAYQMLQNRCSSYQRRNTADATVQMLEIQLVLNCFRFLEIFFSLFLVQDDYWNHVGSVNCLLANV